MKNLAKIIACAIGLFAILFVGCSNGINGTMEKTLLIESIKTSTNDSKIKELNLVATSDTEIVDFGVETGDSRSILPVALKASDLEFYYWGTDQINTANTSINTPTKVTFTPKSASNTTEGTVPVDLSISNYVLKLAAVDKNATITTINESNIMSNAILYAVALVDLRYNETVKFYLSPANIKGNGTVDLNLRTYENGQYWSDLNYSVTASIQKIENGEVLKTSETSAKDISKELSKGSGPYTWDNGFQDAGESSGGKLNESFIKFKFDNVPCGTYNFVVTFDNGAKKYFYSEQIQVLTHQTSIRSTNGTFADDKYYVDIPNPINVPAQAPQNLRVGYYDPENAESSRYLATFQWDDMSYNEEKFVLQLLDVTDSLHYTVTTNSSTGVITDVMNTDDLNALKSIGSAPNDLPDSTVPSGWKTFATATSTEKYEFDNNVYQNPNQLYAGGSLNKNSTYLSLWLPLGRVFVARLTAYNEATGAIKFDESTDTSSQQWIYSSKTALTTSVTVAPTISTSVDNNLVYYIDGVTVPTAWEDKDTNESSTEDDPLGINRYRITYNLSGGNFLTVSKFGTGCDANAVYVDNSSTSTFGAVERSITQAPLYDSIVEYGNLTVKGKKLLDPIIYEFDTNDKKYVTLYKGSSYLQWQNWRTEGENGTLYSKLNWETSTTTDSKTVANTYVPYSPYGIINIGGIYDANSNSLINTVTPTLSADGLLYTNKAGANNAKALDHANYSQNDNLVLFASYAATTAQTQLNQHAYYKINRKNVRVFKTKMYDGTRPDEGSNGNGPTIVGSTYADCIGTNSYTNGELHGGTDTAPQGNLKVSNFYNYLTFMLVETELATSNKDKWTHATLSYKKQNGGTELTINGKTTYKDGDVKTVSFVPGTNTAATPGQGDTITSSADSGDGLAEGAHNAIYFILPTNLMQVGKYKATINAYCKQFPKETFSYEIYFELTEPEFTGTNTDYVQLKQTDERAVPANTYYSESSGSYNKDISETSAKLAYSSNSTRKVYEKRPRW